MQNIIKTFSLILALGLTGCAATNDAGLAGMNIANFDKTHPPAIRELNFPSHGKRLNGLMYQANGIGPHPTVILLHGYPGNEKNLDLAQALRRDGFNVLFFHYRGAWGSEGQFGFNNVIQDVGSAIEFLRENAQTYRVAAQRLTLIGHSMGGFAALQGAANDPSIGCVAGIAAANLGGRAGAFAQGSDTAKGFAAYSDKLQMLAGWDGRKAVSEIVQNGQRFDLNGLGSRLSGKSVLLIAGDKDTAVSAEAVHTPMVTAYQTEKDLRLTHKVLSGDHSFSWSRGALIQNVSDWAKGCQ